MKRGNIIVFIVLIIFQINSLTDIEAQNTQQAYEYLQTLSEVYAPIQKETWDYTSTMAHSRSAKKVEKKRIDLLKAIKNAIYQVKKMPAFEDDYSLRDSVVSYLQMSFYVLNDDYAKIIDMEEVAEQSYDLMEAYLLAQELANDKLDQAVDRLDVQFNAFADKYNINIVENEDKLSQKLKQSSEALKYYNQIFLIYFKAYKQEIYMYDAIERQDINAIEQNRNALISISDEGMEKLKEIPPLKGDNTINASCKRLLIFYQDEAENKIPEITEFLIVANEYKEMSELFESKDRMALTQNEINSYNAAVDKYNKGINKYNSLNNSLNSKRQTNYNNWENSVNSFMKRHVPRR